MKRVLIDCWTTDIDKTNIVDRKTICAAPPTFRPQQCNGLGHLAVDRLENVNKAYIVLSEAL